MRDDCIQAVQAAAQSFGRTLTQAQIANIDSRIASTMGQLARTEKDWQTLSRDQRLQMAAERAMQDMQADAARKLENAHLQVVKTAATDDRIQAIGGKQRGVALVTDMDHTANYVQGIKMESVGNLMRLIDAVKSGDGTTVGRRVAMFLFDAQNPQMTRDLAAEVFSQGTGHTGNKVAQAGAKAWLEVIEGLRQRFNNGGGDVGRLDYGYLPQPHDPARVRGNASTAARDKWVGDTMPLVDRSRYVDEAGARLPDADVERILQGVWETIGTEGLNKQEPGQFKGTGARANKGSEHRELHFKDADSFLAYIADYGRGSMYDAMVGHIGGISRDIGLVERYGPNANAQMRLQFDLAAKADGAQVDNLPRSLGMRPQSYWDTLNGTAASPASARLAQLGTDIRNIQTFGKLAGAVISSITDVGTYIVTTGFNRLPYWDAFKNYGKVAGDKATRDFLTSHGIIAESMIGDLNRWTNDNIKQTWSGRLAQSTLKLSLMNAWTDTLRRAFSLTMMQGLAKMSKTEWGKLAEWDRTHLERKGLTEADWQVITRAELTDFQGREHLTPEAVRATGDERSNEVVAKVLGLIQDESENAVINPDLATKTMASGGGLQRGTVKGELARSVMQFKSFPIAMVSRHWRRILDAPQGLEGAPMLANRLLYGGAMLVSTTALGAIAYQAKQIVSGKDPVDMTGPHAGKFWGKALAQGGGLSIAGDMLFNDPGSSTSDAVRSMLGTLAGPAVGTTAQGASIGIENAWKAAKGKPTHTGAESVNLMRQNAPYVNLWYAKAALDHAGMHALQDNLSPGYLSRMQKNASKDWGQGYWWVPGTGLPNRAPDMGRVVGQ